MQNMWSYFLCHHSAMRGDPLTCLGVPLKSQMRKWRAEADGGMEGERVRREEGACMVGHKNAERCSSSVNLRISSRATTALKEEQTEMSVQGSLICGTIFFWSTNASSQNGRRNLLQHHTINLLYSSCWLQKKKNPAFCCDLHYAVKCAAGMQFCLEP